MGNLNMEATQIHYRHDNTMTVDKKLQNLEGRVATLEDGEPAEVSKVDIAPVFSAETAYSAGDYVYHEGHLYKFTADHAAGTWSDLDTESAVVTSDLAELQSDLTAKQDATDNSLQTTDKTIVGGINELMSGLTNVDVALALPENTGKNVLPTSLESIKSINSSGSWDGNTATINGVSFQVVTSDDKVTGIVVNRVSANENVAIFTVGAYTAKSGDILSGCPSGGSEQTYKLYSRGGSTNDTGNGTTISAGDVGVSRYYSIAVFATGSPANVEFYPMIRPATITDPTFAPYIPSVESRIESVESGNYRVIATITADGVKTMSELLTELYSSVVGVKNYKILYNNSAIFNVMNISSTTKSFGRIAYATSAMLIDGINITSSSGTWREVTVGNDGTVTSIDRSSEVIQSGRKVELVI